MDIPAKPSSYHDDNEERKIKSITINNPPTDRKRWVYIFHGVGKISKGINYFIFLTIK